MQTAGMFRRVFAQVFCVAAAATLNKHYVQLCQGTAAIG